MAKAKKKNTPSFEDLMSQLEATVERLESDELTLEDAIEAYQQGIEFAKSGHERLAEAERRIEEVTQSGKLKLLDANAMLDEDLE